MRIWWIGFVAAAGCNGGEAEGDLPALFINEFMASNVATLTDDTGAYSDWIELYNAGNDAVSAAGIYLSDDLGSPTDAALDPSLEIPAGGFLLLYADAGVGTGPAHLPIALSQDGESLVLSYETAPGSVEELDTVSFGVQAADVSFARSTDGEGDWAADDSATPGATNE